jgi:Mce-associated membrane protein
MNADDDTPTDPTESVDPVDRVAPARSDPSKPTLAAATLSALRAGARSAPSPADGTDSEPDADHDDAGTDDAVTAGPVRSRRSVLTGVCAIVAVAALIFASVAGVLWWRADHGTARKIGVPRELVLDDARLAIVTVNSSDYRHPSDALANWLDVSTGLLHSQFSQSRSTVVRVLAQAKMVTKATVLAAAVTALDLTKGTASVIASVNVTRTPASGAVSTVRNRFRASMTRTGGEWKLSNLTVVPVSLS